jgi:4'-phosphopantetheinyl transferase
MKDFITIYYFRYDVIKSDNIAARKKEVALEHQIGQDLLSIGLRNEFGILYDQSHLIKGKYGKPALRNEEGYFNISHCNGLVVCALSSQPLGIDVENERKYSPGLLRKICNDWEENYILKDHSIIAGYRFRQIWTLKESYIKMTGEGLRFPLNKVNFELSPWFEADPMVWKDPDSIQCNQEGYFYQCILDSYVVSLCSRKRMELPALIPISHSY